MIAIIVSKERIVKLNLNLYRPVVGIDYIWKFERPSFCIRFISTLFNKLGNEGRLKIRSLSYHLIHRLRLDGQIKVSIWIDSREADKTLNHNDMILAYKFL